MKSLCVEENWVPPGEVNSNTSAEEMALVYAKVFFCYREAPGSGLTRAQLGGMEFRGLNFAQGVFVVLTFPPADHCATNPASLFSGPTVWG